MLTWIIFWTIALGSLGFLIWVIISSHLEDKRMREEIIKQIKSRGRVVHKDGQFFLEVKDEA